jgi:hypothetical protein
VSKITDVIFAENSVCESIGTANFSGCTALTSITIPASVTSISESHPFSGCTALTEINFNATAMRDVTGEIYAFHRAGQLGAGITVNIGANVTRIPSCLFYTGNSGTYAPKITSVVFAENSRCASIGRLAFLYCSGLASIAIPASVTSIGEGALDGTAWYDAQSDGLVYAGKVLYKYKGTMPANTVINNIRTDTVGIAGYAFGYCSSLISITIPLGVTRIEDDAFSECTALESIVIPASVTNIGARAFNGCGVLVNLTFEENSQLTSIDTYVFSKCSSLVSVTIPASVTSIGAYAFNNCISLSEIRMSRASSSGMTLGVNWNNGIAPTWGYTGL